MKEVPGKDIMRRVMHLCGGSIDLVDINNGKDLSLLDACLQHEIQCSKRVTMIQNLKARIKKLEKDYHESTKVRRYEI